MSTIDRILELEKYVIKWLHDPDSGLTESADYSISSGLFSQSDVDHAIRHFRRVISEGSFVKWYKDIIAQLDHPQTKPQDVLCLHAGNLPLVGLQDVLAVLISGHDYYGKLSRKDPFIIESLLKYLVKSGIQNVKSWSSDLSDFYGINAQKWMFAGAEDSLPQLNSRLLSGGIITTESKNLIRTAHFSVAIVPECNETNVSELVESMFRYQGKGCRSVAVVFSDNRLVDCGHILESVAQDWFRSNGFSETGSSVADYRHAYNKAIGIPSLKVGNFVIQEGVVSIDHPEIIYWQCNKSVEEIVNGFGNGLQQIYIGRTVAERHLPASIGIRYSATGIKSNETEIHTETKIEQVRGRDDDSKQLGRSDLLDYLENAQQPALDWKPDGVDVLEWLLTH